ncbi:cryptochrome/photolyase family protein [Thermodesulfobacteriota bacterium]
MSVFKKELARFNPEPFGRRWLFIPYDQLSDGIGPLSREYPQDLGIVLVENPWKAARRPYHKQKLALILANMRCFALEQAQRGVAIRHVVASGPYRMTLEPLAQELGEMRVMEPAERELRKDLEPFFESGQLELIPHEGWLTKRAQFDAIKKEGPRWRMDAFYRHVRKDSGILMEKNKPLGGKFSFDVSNRKPWHGKPPAPIPPTFPSNPIKEEVGQLIQDVFSQHPGRLDLKALPSTREDSQILWSWAKHNCLDSFGPYEDAMSILSTGIFHTRISSLLNIHRLLPKEAISDAVSMDLPLESKEGFVRQILGWREFVHHIHDTTDGFRMEIGASHQTQEHVGDGGYSHWSGKPWQFMDNEEDPDGGASPCFLGGETPLPPAYWGRKSGLNCLDHVVASVWYEGYSHHITRLMILSNIGSLLDVNPRELTDWFWVAYTDAYDWVVEPNVLGLGTYALGDLITTKPYISGAAYIHRMSDFCSGCQFDPKKTCPITNLYWAFLGRHRDKLKEIHRLAMPIKSQAERKADLRNRDRKIFRFVRERLVEGEVVFASDIRTL